MNGNGRNVCGESLWLAALLGRVERHPLPQMQRLRRNARCGTAALDRADKRQFR
jgi:hypothetical protein